MQIAQQLTKNDVSSANKRNLTDFSLPGNLRKLFNPPGGKVLMKFLHTFL